MFNRVHVLASLTLVSLLSACGGGGGGGGGPTPPPADLTPPDTTISAPPVALTNSTSASIAFTSSEANSTFESRLDNAAFAAATSPQNLTGLGDGSHTFQVRARDAAGNVDASPASVTWVVDSAPPDTVKLTGPATLVNVAVATFTFNSPDATATFEVSLDDGAYVAATSPHNTAALAEGAHKLSIRARDGAGNVDATPAITNWTVDLTAPETNLLAAPSGVITVASATINAASPDTTASFEASLDGGAYTPRTLPLTITGLGEGAHEWRVRARDPAGNVDATPVVAQFTVDTLSPNTSFAAAPPVVTNALNANFTLSSDDASATFEASVDGGAYAAVATTFQLTGLAVGQHTISARARDPQGHVDPTPATHTWRIDTTPPTARMQFPLPMSYTHSSTITVRGTAADTYGVASVRVNGVAATSTTGFTSWTAVVPIQAGENQLEVTVRDAAGNETTNPSESTVFNRGPPIVASSGMDYDPTGDRIIVSDSATRWVYGYRVSDGFGQLISDRWPPFTAPHDGNAEELVVDAANNRALIVDWGLDMLVGVDLTSGLRSGVSLGNVVPGATQFGLGFGIALDAAGQRAFVTARQSKSVIGVNLASGTRSVVSSPTVGTGAALGNPLSVVYDNVSAPGTPRLLVADATFGAAVIVAIDLVTGNRLPFSSAAPIGQGVTLGSPTTMKLDAANSRLLVQDGQLDSLLAVDLATGNRSVVSGPGTGSGPAFEFLGAIGMAIKPSTGTVMTAQRGGEILAVNPANGNRSTLVDSNVGTGAKIYNTGGLIVEQASGTPTSLLLMEADAHRITRINLANGNRTTVSGDPGNGSAVVGTGPALDRAVDLVLDRRPSAGGNSVLVLVGAPGNSLLSVNLATGNRTLVANLSSVSPAVTQPRALALDLNGNRVLFTNNDNSGSTKAVYAIDLGSGARTTISGNGIGTGNAFSLPTNIALDSASAPTRAFVSDGGGANAIVQVDLATGNRSVAIPGVSGVGSSFTLPGPLLYDTANSRLIIGNLGEFQKLIAAPLPFSSRSLISGSEIDFTVRGTGPLQHYAPFMAANLADGVIFLVSYDSLAVYAVDTFSGDRVYISR